METLNKLAYNILNKFNGGRSTSNDFISLDQIKYNILHYRSLFIRRELRNDETLQHFEQPLNLEFIRKTSATPPFATNSALKSTIELPAIIRLKDRLALSIYNNAETKVIPVEQSYHRMTLHEYNRFTRKDARAYIKDNHLFVASDAIAFLIDSHIKGNEYELTDKDAIYFQSSNFKIRGVFEYPSEVYIINGKDPLTVDDLPFPISGDMSARVTEGLISGTLPLIGQTQPDVTHDNLPNPRQ
jgi:hypothetical protein